MAKYLIVFKDWRSNVPQSLRDGVRKQIEDELGQFDVELDFAGTQRARDLVVTLTRDLPIWSVFGESVRPSMNNEIQSGESTIYIGFMKTMRMQIGSGSCEATFTARDDSLGSMIANTVIHEIGHMLGMDGGGFDDGGHTTDRNNYMWSALSPPTAGSSAPAASTRVGDFFEYTVKRGDTLSRIVQSYVAGTLDKCRVGPSGLTYQMVWEHPQNREPGFVADPAKGKIPGRRANNPNWIYPGEKVALINHNLRTQGYKIHLPGFLGKKTFSPDQIKTMKEFIARRLAEGKG